MTAAHTRGLRRGYASNLRIDWDRRGKGGFSTITRLNTKKRPVAVLLGDYMPGEIDVDMEAAARLFCAAPDLLAALKAALRDCDWGLEDGDQLPPWVDAARAAIAKATGQ